MIEKECIICGFDKRVHKHHIVKRRELGSDDEENLVFLCPNHHWEYDNNLVNLNNRSLVQIQPPLP